MISFQDLKTPSFVRELGRVLNTPGRSFDILDRIGYRGIRDNFDDPEFAWERVLGEIGNSAEVDASTSIEGFRVLVNAVLHRYPENRIFQQTLERLGETAENRAGTGAHRDAQAEPEQLPQDEWRSGCAIYLRGSASTERLLEEINRLLRQMGIANGAAIRLDAGALRAINLPGVTVEQGNKIRESLQNSGLQRDGRTDCLGVFNNQSRDSIISRLTVSGPDQQRFELLNVPGSTSVRQVGLAIMTQYPDEFTPSDRGRTRQAVVDLLTEGGGRRRLSNPDQRLDDAGVRSGDTLDVNPEVVAGAIDPRLHEQGLARARAQIVAFKEGAGRKFNFSVRANTALPPTEYLLNFEAPSFAPPPAQGGSPERIGRHEVFLLLPADFPMKAPLAIWQTPIWHPNIALKTGDVCLGALAESYRPDFDFGVLCQMLIDIASYQSYAWVQKVLNAEASVWAFGEGQAQIQQIGGRRERKREVSDTDEIDAGLTIREL